MDFQVTIPCAHFDGTCQIGKRAPIDCSADGKTVTCSAYDPLLRDEEIIKLELWLEAVTGASKV